MSYRSETYTNGRTPNTVPYHVGEVTLLWWSVGGAAVHMAVKWLLKLKKQTVFFFFFLSLHHAF